MLMRFTVLLVLAACSAGKEEPRGRGPEHAAGDAHDRRLGDEDDASGRRGGDGTPARRADDDGPARSSPPRAPDVDAVHGRDAGRKGGGGDPVHGGTGARRGGGESASPPLAVPGTPARTPRPISPMPRGIVQVSDTRWTISRTLVERWMKSTNQVGIVRDAGAGWSVRGVRSRAAWHLGMRNGDVIMEVNGHKLDTKTQLLGAWLDLRNDKTFDVVFYRKGVRRVHHYQIVD